MAQPLHDEADRADGEGREGHVEEEEEGGLGSTPQAGRQTLSVKHSTSVLLCKRLDIKPSALSSHMQMSTGPVMLAISIVALALNQVYVHGSPYVQLIKKR